jgi:WD40 repeat protein
MAVSPDGKWLAACSANGSVWISNTPALEIQTLMRMDSKISSCIWLDNEKVAIGGTAGLCVFDFIR